MTPPSSQPGDEKPAGATEPAESNLTTPPAERRERIAHALDTCIRQQGLNSTTLTDIALAAGMSTSHLRYYFARKEDIIEYYLKALVEELVAEICRIPRLAPEQWLVEFANYFVGNPRVSRTNIAVMIEIFGVSVHNQKLLRIKARFDDFIRRTFLDFFLWTGTGPGITAEDAAYTAWSLEIGMKFNAAFQLDFSNERAHSVFLKEMRRLAGM